MFLEFLPRLNIDVELCETEGHEQLEEEITKGCKMVYLESHTNPTLKIIDLQRIATVAKKAGAIVVADNTFGSLINQNPLALGIDLVIHSATKFLGGRHQQGIEANRHIRQLLAELHNFRAASAGIQPSSLRGIITSCSADLRRAKSVCLFR